MLALATLLGKPPEILEDKHPHSHWIAELFETLVEATEDLDTLILQWFRDGAPAGFRVPIPPGPFCSSMCGPPGASEADLIASERNHPCFNDKLALPPNTGLQTISATARRSRPCTVPCSPPSREHSETEVRRRPLERSYDLRSQMEPSRSASQTPRTRGPTSTDRSRVGT